MARILAIDWDGVEVRYVLAAQTKDQFTILKAGSAPIDDPKALEEIAEPPSAEPPAEGPGAGEENGDGEEGGQPPAFPPQDIDEDEEDENAQSAAPPEGERYRKIGAKLRALLKSQKVGSAKNCFKIYYFYIP